MFWLPIAFAFLIPSFADIAAWFFSPPAIGFVALQFRFPVLFVCTLGIPFLLAVGIAFYTLHDFQRTLIENRAYLKWAQEQSRKIREAQQHNQEDHDASS